MKVLIINAIYGSRSSGRSIAEIKQELENRGDEVFIATPDKISEKNFYQIGNKLDHKIHAVMSRVLGLQGYFSIIATLNFINYIRNIKPDIIHLQVIHGNFINFSLLMKFIAKEEIPTVFVLDDCWYFTGKCCHYTSSNCYKWKNECSRCARKKADNPSWFFDFSKKMYINKRNRFASLNNYAIITVSDWLKQEVKQSFLHNAFILKRIYNSIDMTKFQYKKECVQLKNKLGLDSFKIVLGVATSWNDEHGLSKGLDLFIKLAKMMSTNIKIVLVGKLESKESLPQNIISIDFVNGAEELAQYYSMADVFVQMSSEETFGKVTAEALSCGTPVIVFNSTANPELVGPGCGFVVENQNVLEVHKYICKILNKTREVYSEKCREYAMNNFLISQNVDNYIQVYHELLDNKHNLSILKKTISDNSYTHFEK